MVAPTAEEDSEEAQGSAENLTGSPSAEENLGESLACAKGGGAVELSASTWPGSERWTGWLSVSCPGEEGRAGPI